jgi:hypothetical protein
VELTGRLAELAKIRGSEGKVVPAIKEILLKRSMEASDRRSDVLHPSEMAKGDWCHRASYFRITGHAQTAETIPFTLENIFQEGNMIHEKWQRWMAQTGELWGDWKCKTCQALYTGQAANLPEEEIRDAFDVGGTHIWEYREVSLVHKGLNIMGHEDGAMVKQNCLVELKSVGIGTLRHEHPEFLAKYYRGGIYDLDAAWKDIRRPLMSHVRQTNIYLWLAKEMGLPFDSCAVIYEFKPNQQVKEFGVSLNSDTMEPLIARAQEVKVALETGKPPKCSHGGCKYCGVFDG